MTAPTIAPAAEPAPATDADDGLQHVYCCEDENLGLCGTDLTTVPFQEFDEASCVVCAHLDGGDCAAVCPKLTRGSR